MTNLTDEEVKQWYGLYEVFRKLNSFNSGSDEITILFKDWIENLIEENKSFETVFQTPYKEFIKQIHSKDDILNQLTAFTTFVNAYKESDKIMGRDSAFLKDDDVYINCKPVDTFGKEITAETNFFKNNNMSNEILDDATRNLKNGELTNNIGFQSIVGIFLIIFLYYIGNYVFVKFPQKIINKE
tara:strand:- start:88 stop:642 length:555 start_codon:yes stop_codon:yes gene_type:complete